MLQIYYTKNTLFFNKNLFISDYLKVKDIVVMPRGIQKAFKGKSL